MDDISARTPNEFLYQQRKRIKLVAHGIADVPIQGRTIDGMPILYGYASVMVDWVELGWEDLDLEIPRGDGANELGQALHTWICWYKRDFTFLQVQPSPRSPMPATDMGPLSSPAQRDHNMDPLSSAAERYPQHGSAITSRTKGILA